MKSSLQHNASNPLAAADSKGTASNKREDENTHLIHLDALFGMSLPDSYPEHRVEDGAQNPPGTGGKLSQYRRAVGTGQKHLVDREAGGGEREGR